MKKLLFLTPELPFPAHSGGKLKSLKLLEWLLEDYDVTLACPLKLDDHLHVDPFLDGHPRLSRAFMGAIHVPRTAFNLARSYVNGVPLNVLRTAQRGLAKRLGAVMGEFDVVFIDHYEVGQYVPANFGGRRVYHAHNAYHKLWERYAEHGSNRFYRAASALEARRVRRAEIALCQSSDLVFASPNDIDALVAAGAERARMHETYHVGDDRQLHLRAMDFDATEERLLYVGNLGWEPNAAGLHWFIERVWPLLAARRPELRLDIVGRSAGPELHRLVAATSGIDLLGFVEDLESVYPRSRVSIAPLTFGAGMKVKVLSAMARGIPVVTTPVGAEGIAAENGRHLMIEEEPEKMALAILQLLADPHLWRRLSHGSRALVGERYTWDSLLAQMRSVMQRELWQPAQAARPAIAAPLGRRRTLLIES